MCITLGSFIDQLKEHHHGCTFLSALYDAAEWLGREEWHNMRSAPFTFEEVQILGMWLDAAFVVRVFNMSTDEGARSRQQSNDDALIVFCQMATEEGVTILPHQLKEMPSQIRKYGHQQVANMFPPLPDNFS